MSLKEEARLANLKMREHKISQRRSAIEQPGVLKKVRRNIKNLEAKSK